MPKCIGKYGTGNPCRSNALESSKYCGKHQDQAGTAPATAKQPTSKQPAKVKRIQEASELKASEIKLLELVAAKRKMVLDVQDPRVIHLGHVGFLTRTMRGDLPTEGKITFRATQRGYNHLRTL